MLLCYHEPVWKGSPGDELCQCFSLSAFTIVWKCLSRISRQTGQAQRQSFQRCFWFSAMVSFVLSHDCVSRGLVNCAMNTAECSVLRDSCDSPRVPEGNARSVICVLNVLMRRYVTALPLWSYTFEEGCVLSQHSCTVCLALSLSSERARFGFWSGTV